MQTLREARRERGWTITRVAGLADVNYPVLAGAEVGRLNLRADEAVRIAAVLGVRPGDVTELAAALEPEPTRG